MKGLILYFVIGEIFMIPRVLIIDDDQQSAEIMGLYLQDFARVHIVNGGRSALDFVQQHQVDVILLDIEMPIMDGFVTLEHLRKIESCINVPVLLITGRSDRNTICNSSTMGIDGYLVKPVAQETLVAKVKEAYESKKVNKNKATILMIDDDMSFLKQMNSILKDNYNVIMINSAKLAIAYMSSHTPDVIILDYQMPLYNGANMLNIFQRSSRQKNIPVIMLSGTLNRKALENCFPYNPFAFLVKPVEKELLIENIEAALKQ